MYETRTAKRWLVASIVCGAISSAILLFVTLGITTPETAFGERWVGTEIVLFHPPPGAILGVPANVDLLIQFKPIMAFMIFGFLWFATAFQSLRGQLNRRMANSSTLRDAISLSAFLLCLIAGYEVVWNFMAFGAILALMPTSKAFNKVVDRVAFEYTYYPVNAVFATKMFFLALFIGLYTLYSLRQ